MQLTKRGAAILAVTLLAGVPSLASADPPTDRTTCIDAAEKAQSLRDAHKLLAAREQLRICGRAVCSPAVVRDCVGWLAETEASIPAVLLGAKDDTGRDLFDVNVSVDGVVVTTKLDGIPIEVDPGPHTVLFEAPNAPPEEQRILARSGEKQTVVSATLAVRLPAAEAPPAASAPMMDGETTALPPPPPPASTHPEGTVRRDIGYVVGALGLVGLGIGGAFGIDAIVLHSTLSCNKNVCSPASTLHAAQSSADVATVGFIAGGVLTATGLALVLTAPRSPNGESRGSLRVAPILGTATRGVQLQLIW